MVNERIIQRIDDMLEECGHIIECTNSITFQEFEKNYVYNSAVTRFFEVLGEAARNVLDHLTQADVDFPEIPWRKLISMRNQVIHEYPTVDLQILWNTAIYQIPSLKQNLEVMKETLLENG